MKILHSYGIGGTLKGALKNYDFKNADINVDEELYYAIKMIKENYINY